MGFPFPWDSHGTQGTHGNSHLLHTSTLDERLDETVNNKILFCRCLGRYWSTRRSCRCCCRCCCGRRRNHFDSLHAS